MRIRRRGGGNSQEDGCGFSDGVGELTPPSYRRVRSTIVAPLQLVYSLPPLLRKDGTKYADFFLLSFSRFPVMFVTVDMCVCICLSKCDERVRLRQKK